ncbi:unnamed protein product, partial [Eruca vesicaria subsp. sativa]|nr:unnamed protein product [Eruca vesicaria subsp. sativa]
MDLNNNGIAYGDTTLVRPTGTHKATIVWLHDIGENGHYSAHFVEQLQLGNIKWICPTAPTRPVSSLGGAETTAWCDVTQVFDDMEDDLPSLNTTSGYVVGGMGNMGLNAVLGINGWLPSW